MQIDSFLMFDTSTAPKMKDDLTDEDTLTDLQIFI